MLSCNVYGISPTTKTKHYFSMFSILLLSNTSKPNLLNMYMDTLFTFVWSVYEYEKLCTQSL